MIPLIDLPPAELAQELRGLHAGDLDLLRLMHEHLPWPVAPSQRAAMERLMGIWRER